MRLELRVAPFFTVVPPARLYSRAEVLSRPSPVPAASGLYAWYFREIPPHVPTDGCLTFNGATLLYLGIAPDKANKPNSRSTLRKRICQHYLERERGHIALAVVGRVHGAVEMRADVQRGVDALRHDHLRLQVLRVVHLVAGIADPAGRVHVHDVGEIDDFHNAAPFVAGYFGAERCLRNT